MIQYTEYAWENFTMSKINLAILFGGASSEHDVSCVSAKGINGDNGNFAFVITRKQGEKAIYTYEAHIVCSKDFKKGNHSVDEKGIYLDSFNNTYTSYYES